jgi:DNA modification methylase
MPHFEHTIRPISELIPYAKNSRLHSDHQIAVIAGAMKEFGFTNPVLIDEAGGIIAGHGRIMAARKLKMKDVPCIVVPGLSDTQRRALVISDNRSAELATWDNEMLAMELGDLAADGFDLAGIVGFSDEDLAKLIGGGVGSGLTDEDAVPEPPAHPVSQIGDVWIMGRHRLVCGDSTDALVSEKCLSGVKPHLMVTDPPYGVAYDPAWRGKALNDGAKRAEGAVSNDGKADWREAWALFPGDVAYVWHGMLHSGEVVDSLAAMGFEVRAEIVWVKGRHVLSRGHYHPQHESCWYAVKKGGTGHWAGDRKQTTIWQIDHARSETGHGTQKPVEAMRRPVLNNSSAGHAVYEPFSGSGTTIIACETAGRSCHAIEIDPQYVDVAVKRWQDFTGLAAVLDESGKTFAEVSEERPFGG